MSFQRKTHGIRGNSENRPHARRYIVHPDNHYCLIIDQRRIYVEVWARANNWGRGVLDQPDDAVSLPEFGFSAPLSAIYRGTEPAR